MYCCKTNARFLKRLSYLINEAERNFSATVTEVQKKLPEYPPILDLSYFATKRRERDVMHNYLKCIPTVEEKQIELNMPRYYGWKSFHIKEGVIPYNALPYAQYITKTHLASTDNLPSSYDDIVQNETLDNLVDVLKKPFEDMLIFEHNFINKDYQYTEEQLNDPVLQDNLKAKSISQKVHRILLSHLSLKYPHLIEAQVDDNPRIEAFWFSGGLPPHDGERKLRTKCLVPDIREDPDRPVQKPFQYYGSPMFQLRHCLPLKEILSLGESENLDFPYVSRDPIIEGYFDDRKHATNIPGFWPGDTNEFGLLSYHNRGYLKKRVKEFLDDDEAITTQAIFASYAWLTSQAFYQGFTTFNEITYPLINQAIITNGQYWSFCVYQLNTMANCVDRFFENPRRNICWISKPLKLFDSVENGKVNGLNPDVIKNLIKFYANKPVARLGIEMKPNLGVEKYIAGHEDDEKRNWLEGIYKNLVSNRPRHRLPPEIYLWQRIYLIRHKMRPLDKKFEPWEFGINRYKRRLDDYAPVYIPRFVRGDFHRRKRKFARTYYPTREQYDPTFVKEYEYTKKKIRTYLDDPKPSV